MQRIVLLTASLTIVLAACTPATTVPETTSTISSGPTTVEVTTTESPDEIGRELIIGVDLAIETLNPFAANSSGGRVAGNLVWAMVYDIDPETWQKIPDVVTAMPSRSGAIGVGDDGSMTVKYEIDSEATWSDGEPITGFDLAFTVQAMKNMAIAGVGGVDPVMATVLDTEADGKSASITFAEPTLAFEDALWIILPEQALVGVDLVNGTDGSDWPSGGPFVVEKFDPFSESRFVRNDKYWKSDEAGESLPYLDAVTIAQSMMPGAQAGEPVSPMPPFLARDIDLALIPQTSGDFDAIDGLIDQGAAIQQVPTPVIEQLTFNFSDPRLVDNPDSANAFIDFRRTVATSIDRPQLLRDTGVPWFAGTPGVLNPIGESAWSMYEMGIAQIPELPDGATSVLSTTADADERPKIAEALAPAFTAAGVDYEVSLVDSQEFFQSTIVGGTYDIGMWAWVSDGSIASQFRLLDVFDPRTAPPEGNFGNWGSGGTANDATTRFSEIVDEVRTTIDVQRFSELIEEAEAILATELVLIPLFSRGSALALWPDAVAGVTHNGSASTFTWNIETWQDPTP